MILGAFGKHTVHFVETTGRVLIYDGLRFVSDMTDCRAAPGDIRGALANVLALHGCQFAPDEHAGLLAAQQHTFDETHPLFSAWAESLRKVVVS